MKKPAAVAAALVLVLALSARPASAQSPATPPVVVDRTAFTLTYLPTGGTSTTDFAVSYQYNPAWDVLVSSVSAPGASAFRIGGRYHVRPPAAGFDVYGTLYYASPSPGTSRFELGGGITQTWAPGVKSYAAATYVSATPAYITTNIGIQYELNRQFALVVGYELSSGLTNAFLGFNFDFSVR